MPVQLSYKELVDTIELYDRQIKSLKDAKDGSSVTRFRSTSDDKDIPAYTRSSGDGNGGVLDKQIKYWEDLRNKVVGEISKIVVTLGVQSSPVQSIKTDE